MTDSQTKEMKKFKKRAKRKEDHYKQMPIYLEKINETIIDGQKLVYLCNTKDLKNLNIYIQENKNNYNIIIKQGEKYVNTNETHTCSICLENIEFVNYENNLINKSRFNLNKCSINDGFITECGHTFHRKCLIQSIIMNNVNCPMCRCDLKNT